MTATDELRRLLDERGVEWWCGEDERKTYWRSNDLTWEYFNDENGDAWLGFLGACESDVTPAQAIAATLGDADATPTRQGVGPMTLAEAIAHEDWAASTAHGELADEHAQMRDWLRELERLRGENARLRRELESVGTAAYLYGRSDLRAENAKLQKVCKRMRDHIKDSCDVCDEYYCSSWDEDNECCVFDTYIRELGLEVDE